VSRSVDFYFDFTSPYGYLASERIDDLAARHGREVAWRPVLLGIVFKTTGMQPLTAIPLKGEYSTHDIARSARYYGVPFRMPSEFPKATQSAARALYWIADRNAAQAREFARSALRAYFVEDQDIASPAVTLGLTARHGIDRGELEQALGDPAIKERLKTENEQAIARGVFGSPFFIVDGEPFWGCDRMQQLERWLATGPW
jgi:2-hydroxychromene-2-carboxylate isomerase